MKLGKVIPKWIQVLTGVILIILVGIFILNISIKNKIRQLLTQLSPAIKINYSSLRSNFLTRSVSIDNLDINFSPYATMPQQIHSMNFPHVAFKGINFSKFIFHKQIFADRLIFANGNVHLDSFLIAKRDSAQVQIFEQIKSRFKTAIIRNLELIEINSYLSSDSSTPLATGDIIINGIKISRPGSKALEQYHYTSIDCNLRNMNFGDSNAGRVQIAKLALDGKNAAMKVDSLYITTSEQNKQNRIEVVIPSLQIYGLQTMNFFQNRFVAEEISMRKGEIRFQKAGELQFSFSNIPVSLEVKNFNADKLSIDYEDQLNQLTMHAFIKMHDAMIIPSKDSFNYKDLQCRLAGFQLSGKRSRHNLIIQNIIFDSKDENLRIHDLKVSPKYGKYEFARKLGHQADRFEASIPEINIIKPDLTALLRKRFLAEKIVVGPSMIHIFRDRRLPMPQRICPLPMAFLKKFPFEIRAKSLQSDNATVEYEEYPLLGYSQTGILRIEKITATMSPFINQPLATDPDYAIMKVKCAIMGSGLVSGSIKMPTRAASYHVEGVIERMDLTKLNSTLENLSRMRIKSGFLDYLYFNFLMDDKQSTGKIIGAYHKLVLQQLEKHQEEKEIANFASFMLRRLIIPLNKDASLPQKERTGNVIYTRDKSRSGAYYLLQSLLTGVKASFTLGFLLKK